MITRDDCIYNISDEDCNRCTKHRSSCIGCEYCEVHQEARNEFEREQREFLKQWKDDVVESLAKYDAETVGEVYQQGRTDEKKRFAKILSDFYGDEPCNYNELDECCDEWCEVHCGKGEHTVMECWEHAISSGWLEEEQKE